MTSALTIYVVLACFMTSHTISCLPCTFSTKGTETKVICSHRRLTSLKRDWPPGVTWLDASTNNLTSDKGLENPKLLHLRHLDLRNNYLPRVPKNLRLLNKLEYLDLSDNPLGSLTDKHFGENSRLQWLGLHNTGLKELPARALASLSNLVTLDLSNNELNTVPVSALRYLQSLQSLKLGSNQIEVIDDYSFNNLTNLQSLSLNGNRLSFFTSMAFAGLRKLIYLDMRGNSLWLDNSAYASGVFRPLVALQSLFIGGNDNSLEGDYPTDLFSPLASLRELSVDTFYHSHFGAAFSALKNLTHLYLDNDCKMTSLSNTTFEAFKNSSLESLSLVSCKIGRIETCAFCDLPSLRILVHTRSSHMNVDTALNALYGLQHQNMSLIDLSGNKYHIFPEPITDENTRFLSNICVDTFKMAFSLVSGITPRAFGNFRGKFSSCIKHFDLSFNAISSWNFERLYFKLMYGCPQLETLQVQDQYTRNVVDDLCTFAPGNPCEDWAHFSHYTFYIPLAPRMKLLNVSGTTSRIPQVFSKMHILNASNLLVFDFSYFGIERCDFNLFGLTAIQDLRLRGSNCRLMKDTLFHHMETLRRLDLSNFNLDPALLMSRGKFMFSKLPLLEELDLSINGLANLQPDLLVAQPRLRSLNLARNRFQSIPVDVTLHQNFSLLDLSRNMMTSLSAREQHVLDTVAEKHSFTLRLRGNPLSCTCSNLGFVRWLASTSVRLDGDNDNDGYDDDYDDNGRSYPCVVEDGSMSKSWVVIRDWDFHWRRCVGRDVLWLALALLSLQLLAILITFVLSRNWTHVMYVWHVVRNYKLPRRADFRKDVYVGYSDVDVDLAVELERNLERRRDLRLLLRYRDEVLGIRAENVVEDIDDCWKVLVVVTQAMTQDDWSIFTVHQAQRSITDTMPDRVVVLFVEDPRELPHMKALEKLLRMVPERNVFHIPRHTSPRHPDWDTLAEVIRGDVPAT